MSALCLTLRCYEISGQKPILISHRIDVAKQTFYESILAKSQLAASADMAWKDKAEIASNSNGQIDSGIE